jgi:hypothetical protein
MRAVALGGSRAMSVKIKVERVVNRYVGFGYITQRE